MQLPVFIQIVLSCQNNPMNIPYEKPPYVFQRDLRKQLISYLEKELEANSRELSKNLLERKIRFLQRSSVRWISDFGKFALAFTEMYYQESDLENFSAESKAIMKVGLQYLIDIYDVIPDVVQDKGYLDDYHMLHLCLKRISLMDSDSLGGYFLMEKGSVIDVNL